MKSIAIIQARMSSSRLPGKVMLKIGDRPMLEWVVERTLRAQSINEVVVATTIDPSDDPVFKFCRDKEYRVGRGSVHDVLDRYYQIAKQFHTDVVIRITADCPLIDPKLIDQTMLVFTSDLGFQEMGAHHFDFVANRLPPPWGRTFPIGLDIEIFSFNALEQAHQLAKTKYQREHVTPYFYEGTPVEQLQYHVSSSLYSSATSPQGFNIALLHHAPDYGKLRWTVDTPEDIELVRKIATYFSDDTFSWLDVLQLVEKNPELTRINSQVKHKTHLDVDSRATG
ncbi:MAG: cytidylyltransferase domain-containing protein [Anaerolineales bacterium]|jgi:spore coat polysaccharide biosynthesis protein SpsF